MAANASSTGSSGVSAMSSSARATPAPSAAVVLHGPAAKYPLHAAVWRDDAAELRRLLRAIPRNIDPRGPGGVDEFDNHGNTALHLCLILNRSGCLDVLLANANPDCRIQSRDGWSPLAEAVSLGNRDVIRRVILRRNDQIRASLKTQMPTLFHQLEELGDFRLEMHWHFNSWIPFVSALCPSDTNIIYKHKSSLRFDTTIAGFERLRWLRGNLSILVLDNDKATGSLSAKTMSVSEMRALLERYGVSHADCFEKPDLIRKTEKVLALVAQQTPSRYGNVYLVNHDRKAYMMVSDEVNSESEIDSLTNVMMKSERTYTKFDQTNLKYKRATSGIWGWQSERSELIGDYNCQVWDVTGVALVTQLRTEHINAAKTMQQEGEAAAAGTQQAQDDDGEGDQFHDAQTGEDQEKSTDTADGNTGTDEVAQARVEGALKEMAEMKKFHPSLPPPPPPTLDMDAYFDSERSGTSTHPPTMGRPLHLKQRMRSFKGKVWTSEEFPLSRDDLLSILQAVAPSSHMVEKVVDFLKLDLPPGFPVRLEVPILPMLTVQITFQNFQRVSDMSSDLFSLRGYQETDRIL